MNRLADPRVLAGLMVLLVWAIPCAAGDDLTDATRKIVDAWDQWPSVVAKTRLERDQNKGVVTSHTVITGTYLYARIEGKRMYRQELKTEHSRTGPILGEGEINGTTVLVGDGEILTSYTEDNFGKIATRSLQKGSTIGLGGEDLLDSMTGDSELTREPDEVLDGEPVFVITTRPKKSMIPRRTVYYISRKHGILLKRLNYRTVEGKEEVTSTFTVTDIRTDAPPEKDRFNLEIPEGARMIDQTSKPSTK